MRVPLAAAMKPSSSATTSLVSFVCASNIVSTTPLTRSRGFIRLFTSCTVSSSLANPCSARKCGCIGIITSLATPSALIVSSPSDGGQSIRMKSKSCVAASIRSLRIVSRPSTLTSSISAAARSMLLGISATLSSTLWMALRNGASSQSTS
jgi:hypothetical protein